MDVPPFERVGIVGLGAIGGSVALAARRRWPSVTITACDPAPVSREAVTQGLVAALVTAPVELAACDLIIIATPIAAVTSVIGQLSHAGVGALVMDVASTKRVVMDAAGASRLAFAGGHPVVDTKGLGVGAARADVFDGRPWLLVSSPRAGDAREAMLVTFVVGLGARPEWTDAVTHDRVMAHVSHAPHAVSAALKSAAGAASSASDWEGIVNTNADFIADALTTLAAKLPESAGTLTHTSVVRDIFERAAALKTRG